MKFLYAIKVHLRGFSASIPESGKFPGEGNSNTLQYSWLGNPMDRGAWWATVQWVSELDTTEVTEHAMFTCFPCQVGYIIRCKLDLGRD